MQKGFRQDIQGLRALAVGLVAVGHARLGLLHGGFVGVDVFFVISGFLITGLLVGEGEKSGTVSLLGFYARRARRILPAATLVVGFTVVTSLIVLNAIAAQAAVKDAVWATFFAANIKFGRDGTDYFNAGAAVSPLQHYWSLAVEEQFYLVWPLLVLLLCLLVRGRRTHVRDVAVPVLTLVVAASFTWSVIATAQVSAGSGSAAYFSPFTRAWELAIGALAACLAPRIAKLPAELLGALSWLGLAGVVVAALVYDEQTPFPGSAAALPVIGAALLLLGGLRASRFGPQAILSVRPVRVLGDWSYSFYLWHWPLLILGAAEWGLDSAWSRLAVLLVALGLSGLTYHFVENPFRRARALTVSRLRGVLLYPAVVVISLPLLVVADRVVVHEVEGGGAAITTENYGQKATDPAPHFSTDPVVALVQASVLAARNGMDIPAHLDPALLGLKDDKPDVGDCEYFSINVDRPLCAEGDPNGSRTLVLIGDSHARQWIPALDALGKKYGWKAYFLVREGCPGADVTPWLTNGKGASKPCAAFQDWAVGEVSALGADAVFLASQGNPDGFEGPDGTQVKDDDGVAALLKSGMESEIDKVSTGSDRVVVIGDPPELPDDPGTCLSARGATLLDCLYKPDQRSLQMIDALRQAAKDKSVQFVETASWFCAYGRCPSVVGHYVPHRDPGHISVSYDAYLAGELEDQIHLAGG